MMNGVIPRLVFNAGATAMKTKDANVLMSLDLDPILRSEDFCAESNKIIIATVKPQCADC